jgi:hypothetical protein
MKLLGTCRATVYALCKRGALSYRRVTNVIWISADDIHALVAGRSNHPDEGVRAP